MNRRNRNRTASRRAPLGIEALEERSLLSASPLTWTAPAGRTPNQIGLTVNDGRIEVFDNGHLVASQNVADTSAITITTNARVPNEVTVVATPAGVPTTVNLKGPDLVLIGDTNVGQIGTSNGNPFLNATSPATSAGPVGSQSLLHGAPPPPTVPAGSMANILGDVTINGATRDVVELADRLDSGSGHVAISATAVAGLAPATIHPNGLGTLAIDGKGSTFGTAYTVTGAHGHLYLRLRGIKDSVAINSTSGWVNVGTNSPFATARLVGAATGTNTLTGSTGAVSLRGAGYGDVVAGFGIIAVTSPSPHAVADLQTAGTGTGVTADPNDVTLTAGNQQLTAVGFHNVTVTSKDPVGDYADVTGPTTGTNRLSAGPGSVSLAGTGYHVQLSGFQNTTTFSKSAQDTALLLGDLAGGNVLYAWPGHVYMARNGGYRNDAEGFASVFAAGAAASSDPDTAYLYGSQSGTRLTARPNDVVLAAGGYRTEVGDIATINVDAESTSSVADLTGTALEATPSLAVLDLGSDQVVNASGFATVSEHLTAQTYALTSDGTLLQQTHITGPRAAAVRHATVLGGGSLLSGWITVDTGVTRVLVGNLVNHNYVWDQDGSGVRVFAPSVASAATDIARTLSDLSDTQFQTTVLQNMVRDGSLSYNGMLAAFNTVEVEDIYLSAGQLADLRLLVQCATTLKMPADVASLADSVVNGQQANGDIHALDAHGIARSWGGEPTANVHAGARATDLIPLVDAWFLGMSEPFADTAYIQIVGGLFHSFAAPPSFLDVSQGQVGDCWLLADLEEIAIQQPSAIRSMFVHEGTNTVNGNTTDVYAVRFFNNGVPHYVTVDTWFPAAANDATGRTLQYADDVTGALWPALLEKACAEAAAAGWLKVEHSPSDSYAVLQGGWPSYVTPTVVNQKSPEHDINFDAAVTAFRAGKLVILDTGGSPADSNIVPNHAYPVQGYDAATHSLILVNPWGVSPDGSALTSVPGGTSIYGRFEASASMVEHNFSKMSISGSAPAADPGGGLTSAPPSIDFAALIAVLSERRHV